MTISEPITRQIRRAQTRQSQTEQTRLLTDKIMAPSTAAAAKAKALTLIKGQLTEAELQAWQADYAARLQTIHQHPEQNLGHIEESLADAVKEPLRLLAERAAQAKANATACQCRACQCPLTHRRQLSRVIDSRFGPLTLWRDYGWCPHCQEWQFPADYALGLAKKASASPYVQEIAALLVTKMPAEQAVPVAQRLGLDLSRCLLHCEAQRQGRKAQEQRAQTLAQLDTWSDLQKLAGHTEGPPTQPFTLVIEIDAWNIRERDQWGQTQELRQQGNKIERWHWVYMATIFHLDHRGQTAGQRSVISQRG